MLDAESIFMKMKKYTFTKETRMLLLHFVCELDVHLAADGEQARLLAEVYEEFAMNLPTCSLLRHQKPRVRTMRDKPRSIVTAQKSGNANNLVASGVSEVVTEEYQLLYGFPLVIEETELKRENKKEAFSQAEDNIVVVGVVFKIKPYNVLR